MGEAVRMKLKKQQRYTKVGNVRNVKCLLRKVLGGEQNQPNTIGHVTFQQQAHRDGFKSLENSQLSFAAQMLEIVLYDLMFFLLGFGLALVLFFFLLYYSFLFRMVMFTMYYCALIIYNLLSEFLGV